MASLRFPFPALSADNFLSRGAGGQVFFISSRIVFKCPTRFHNPAPPQAEEETESETRIAREKAVYELLIQKPHPDVVRCILTIPEGIFLERLETTLQARIDDRAAFDATDPAIRAAWIRQITRALSWLESLGYAHGDLRPANILVAADDTVRLADFDASVRVGEPAVVASEPFTKLDRNLEPADAGPTSEQYALASCMYTISFGHMPHHELDAPDRVQKPAGDIFPPTVGDETFGDVTLRCWRGEYDSVAEVLQVVESRCDAMSRSAVARDISPELPSLLAECEEFLKRARWVKRADRI